MGPGSVEDDDQAPFRVVSGGGSELARISCSLRHDTAYKPHEVRPSMGIYSGIPRPGDDILAWGTEVTMVRFLHKRLTTRSKHVHGSSRHRMQFLQRLLVVEYVREGAFELFWALHQGKQSDRKTCPNRLLCISANAPKASDR